MLVGFEILVQIFRKLCWLVTMMEVLLESTKITTIATTTETEILITANIKLNPGVDQQNTLISQMTFQPSPSPLRFIESPWVHQEFFINNDEDLENNEMPVGSFKEKQNNFKKCDVTAAENECNECFKPSIHCDRKLKNKRNPPSSSSASSSESSSLLSAKNVDPSLNELLSQSSQEVWRRKENKKLMKFEKCNFLRRSLINEMCHTDQRPIRKQLLQTLQLQSCPRFSVERALSRHLYSLVVNSTDCSRILRELLTLDTMVENLACEYESILERYDCQARWSVMWTCQDCKLAYRDWLCSMIIPYHINGILVKPCQSICEQVEKKCPHLHPYGKSQYAGEPVFFCIDKHIPFNEEITPNIPFGDEDNCYNVCDLEPCLSESLGAPKLDCPNKSEDKTTTVVSVLDKSNETIDLVTIDPNESINIGEFSSTTILETDFIDENQQTTEPFLEQTTISTSDEIDVGDNFFDESTLAVPTTSISASNWVNDEDYYDIMMKENSKQSKSIQFVELESEYKRRNENQPVSVSTEVNIDLLMYTINSQEQETTEKPVKSSTSDLLSLQEIYQKQIAPTTSEPMNADRMLKKELILNDVNEWKTSLYSTSSSTTALTESSQFIEQTTPPTGTEKSLNIGQHSTFHRNKKIMAYQHQELSSERDDGSVFNTKFRHFNSRNKEFQQQKDSSLNTEQTKLFKSSKNFANLHRSNAKNYNLESNSLTNEKISFDEQKSYANEKEQTWTLVDLNNGDVEFQMDKAESPILKTLEKPIEDFSDPIILNQTTEKNILSLKTLFTIILIIIKFIH